MKLEMQSAFAHEADGLDEGDLSSSVENLGRSPRLRGSIELGEGRLKGWLVDGRAPYAPLEIELLVADRRVAATTLVHPRTGGQIIPSAYRFALSWPRSSAIKFVVLSVLCSDGEKYDLLIESTESRSDDLVSPRSKRPKRESVRKDLNTSTAAERTPRGEHPDSLDQNSQIPAEHLGVAAHHQVKKPVSAGAAPEPVFSADLGFKSSKDLPEKEFTTGAAPLKTGSLPVVDEPAGRPNQEVGADKTSSDDPDAQMKLVETEFDRAFYLSMNPDVEAAGIDPLVHYYYTGWREGRNPSGQFDTNYYLSISPELGSDGPNPFWHYLLIGRSEGRAPSSPKTEAQVVSQADDIPHELRVIREEFDSAYYLATYPDVAKAGVDPLLHFFYTGWKEGRNPNDEFDPSYYLSVNVDVQAAGLNPFWHFIVSGRAEGRLPRRPGGYKRTIIDAATPAVLRPPADLDPVEQENEPGSLAPGIDKLRGNSRGLVVSLSHDCYTKVIGGTQIFISDEQHRFNEQGFTYLHISPQLALLGLAPKAPKFLVRIVVDGAYIGLFDLGSLLSYLKNDARREAQETFLVLHCALGFHVPDVVQLRNVLRPTRSVYWLHDYSSICEGFNLLRNDVEFCGGPPAGSLACRVCVYGESRKEHARQMHSLFEQCRFDVLSPSQFALDLWKRTTSLPHRSAKVHSHWTMERMSAGPRSTAQGQPVSVAFLGFPSNSKGWPLFSHIVRNLKDDTRYQFFHFAARNVTTLPNVRFVQTEVSSVDRSAAISSLVTNNIRVLLFLSPWPETFSFVAHEAVAAGVCIFCLRDSGNVAALVAQHGLGKVFANVEEVVEFLRDGAVAFVDQQTSRNFGFKINNTGTTATAVFSE